MTNHVMEQMNTTGRAGKVSYENMLLAHVVEESVLKSCGGTEAAVRKKVMSILKYAKYRAGGSAQKPGVATASSVRVRRTSSKLMSTLSTSRSDGGLALRPTSSAAKQHLVSSAARQPSSAYSASKPASQSSCSKYTSSSAKPPSSATRELSKSTLSSAKPPSYATKQSASASKQPTKCTSSAAKPPSSTPSANRQPSTSTSNAARQPSSAHVSARPLYKKH